MTDTQIRVLALAMFIICLEFIVTVIMYNKMDRQRKRADYWRKIAKEQSQPQYVEPVDLTGDSNE